MTASPSRPDPAIAFDYGRRSTVSTLLGTLGSCYGRLLHRVCPGKYLAEEIGVYMLAMLMWAFHIEFIDGPAAPKEAQFVGATFR